jgi:hypothetical protein
MRKVLALTAVAGIGLAIGSPARAEAPPVATADCNAVTVTAPADARVIWSIDNEPPSGLEAGQSVTYPFPASSSTHTYVAFVNPGPDVIVVNGTVTDCPYLEPTAEQLAPAPIPGPTSTVAAVAVAEPVVPALDLTAWQEVAIAPPW